LGQTIYEKFADINCPNQAIVKKMSELSGEYTQRNLFLIKQFEEECLWTLYALQEGVTSVISNKRRGNGSIQFIESFFNIKGVNHSADEISQLNILSGNTRIIFDGKYNIKENIKDNERFKVMTFNESGKIEEPPDKNYVKFVDNYFPGTMICAKILLNDDDLIDN